ncbi:nuclear transport factor 2 family protein [Cupriavidus basilensis]
MTHLTPSAPPTPLDALLHWYETLSPSSLGDIARFYSEDARFKDPFNDVRGREAIRRIFAHMFVAADNPRFVIAEKIGQAGAAQAFVVWNFHFMLKGKPYQVHGSSHLRFDESGCVTFHRDYWDAAEELWQQLPVLGPIVAWLRRRFATPLR